MQNRTRCVRSLSSAFGALCSESFSPGSHQCRSSGEALASSEVARPLSRSGHWFVGCDSSVHDPTSGDCLGFWEVPRSATPIMPPCHKRNVRLNDELGASANFDVISICIERHFDECQKVPNSPVHPRLEKNSLRTPSRARAVSGVTRCYERSSTMEIAVRSQGRHTGWPSAGPRSVQLDCKRTPMRERVSFLRSF